MSTITYNPVLYEADLTNTRKFSFYRHSSVYREPSSDTDYRPAFCCNQMKQRFGATSENIHLKISLEDFEGSKPVRIRGYSWTTSKKGPVNGALYCCTQDSLLRALNQRHIDNNKIITIYVKVTNLESESAASPVQPI